MAQRAAPKTESLMHRLHLREISGSLQPHRHARPKKLFTKIPGRLGFGIKSLVPQSVLDEGHVFLGFTKNGQFVISYTLQIETDDHIAYPLYTFMLQWWLFAPHKPLTKIAEVRLFEDSEIEHDLFLAVCEWPRDNKKILVYGQSLSVCAGENYQCYITVTAVPPLVPCEECAATEAALPTETGVSVWCLDHAFNFHTRYDLAPPYPSFSPQVKMKLDGIIILNTGHSIITLDITSGQRQEEDWSDYTNCSTPLMMPESPLEPVVVETEVLEAEPGTGSSTPSASSAKLNRDANTVLLSQDYLNVDRDLSVCDTYPPNSYCPPPEPSDKTETQTSDTQKSRLTMYDFAGSDDGSLVDEDTKSGFALPQIIPNITGKINDETDAKCSCGDSRLRSKYLRQQLQQSMRYSHGFRFGSPQALSPSRCQTVRKSHSQDNIPHCCTDVPGQSSPGDGTPVCSKADHTNHDNLPCPPCDKENVCIPPASPNQCDLSVDIKPNTQHSCSCSLKSDPLMSRSVSVEGAYEIRASQRSFFSPSISGSTGSCASKASTSPIIYLDSSQSVTMNVRNFTYPVLPENNQPTEPDDDLEMAYHSLLPLMVTGSGHRPMTVANQGYKIPLQHEVTVKQMTFDVEHFIWETIRHKAEWGNRYINVADYDVQVLDVCPVKFCLIAKVTLWVHARQELRLSLDVKKRKALGLYQTSFTFEWQQDSGVYSTLDIEDLREIDEKNMRKQSWLQRMELLSLRKQAYIPQSYSTSVHVLTNEAVIKGESLKMLLDPHHYVAILLENARGLVN